MQPQAHRANATQWDSKFHYCLSIIFILGTVGCALAAALLDVTVDAFQILTYLSWPLTVGCLGVFLRRRNMPRLSDVCLLLCWSRSFELLGRLAQTLAIRMPGITGDAILARIDATCLMQVPTAIEYARRCHVVNSFLEAVYDYFGFMILSVLVILPLIGRGREAKEFVLGCVFSFAISLPFMMRFHIHGPFWHYGFRQLFCQDIFFPIFQRIQSETIHPFDLAYGGGLMYCPSFHTIFALLGCFAWRTTPYFRWVFLAWAVLIVISTITTGSHYVIDVVAGLAVSILVQWPIFYLRRETSRGQDRPSPLPN